MRRKWGEHTRAGVQRAVHGAQQLVVLAVELEAVQDEGALGGVEAVLSEAELDHTAVTAPRAGWEGGGGEGTRLLLANLGGCLV